MTTTTTIEEERNDDVEDAEAAGEVEVLSSFGAAEVDLPGEAVEVSRVEEDSRAAVDLVDFPAEEEDLVVVVPAVDGRFTEFNSNY